MQLQNFNYEKNRTNLWHHSRNYRFSAHAVTMPFGQENPDFENSEIIGYLGMFVSLSMIFVAVYQHRKQNGGTISFGKAFLTGLFVTLIAGVIYALSWEAYLSSSDFDFMKEYASQIALQMEKDGLPQESIDAKMEEMKVMAEYYKNPLIRFGMTLMEILPVGILLSLIAGIVFRRNQVSNT